MKFCSTFGALALGSGMLSATGVHADILLDQPHDFRNSARSDWRGGALSIQLGDDFRPTGPVIVKSVTFWMVATWANPPHNWSVAVHRTLPDDASWGFRPEHPWFFERSGPSDLIHHGPWNGDQEMHLYEVRFDDLDLYLDPAESENGVFWFSSFGHITDGAVQNVRWGTAGNGVMNGEGAWWKTIPWVHPGWRRFSFPDGSKSDLAMRIEGQYVPVPGAAIPLILMASLHRRRRG